MYKLKLSLALSTLLFSSVSLAQDAVTPAPETQGLSGAQIYTTGTRPTFNYEAGNDFAPQGAPPAQAPQQTQSAKSAIAEAPTKAKTAAEQGFNDNSDALALQREVKDFVEFNSARQRGVKVNAPGLAFPVSKEKENAAWLNNWEYVLNKAGVPSHQVKFEANRLSKEDFEKWASRRYLFNMENVNEESQDFIQVKHRPITSN